MAGTILDDFISDGLQGRSTETVKTYRHALLQFERWLEDSGSSLNNFARAEVQHFIDSLAAQNKSPATINKIFQAIKAFCRFHGNKERVEGISVIKQADTLHKVPKALDREEIQRLSREMDKSGRKRDYAIIMVLLNTGIRLNELVNLNRDDVRIREKKRALKVSLDGDDFYISEKRGTLRVRDEQRGKERAIPLNSETRRALTQYLQSRKDGDEALFLSSRSKRISPRRVQHIVQQQGFTVHQLRHTFIKELVRAKEDISTIQSLSGHSSLEMILRYVRSTEQAKEGAVEKLYKEPL